MVTPQLLGPDGRPVSSKKLAEEIATPTVAGVRRVAEERVSSGLTPSRLAGILRDAQMGHARAYLTLAEEMEERYLHYASVLMTRKLRIAGISPTMEAPKGVPAKIMDAVGELIADTAFQEAAAALLDGIGKGYSVVEIGWDYRDKLIRPVSFTWRDPRFFQFDPVTLSELRLAVDGKVDGADLPKARFMVHMPAPRMGLPIRRGLARPASWAYMVQSFTLQDWSAFAEVYGIPFRVGKYGPGASEGDKRKLLRAVTSIANDAAAIIPESMLIEFHEVNGSRGEQVFGSLIDYTDDKVSLITLGQTMTSKDGSSYGQAKIHDKVRIDIAQADGRQLGQTVNRDLIQWFVAMNFGPQSLYPKAEWPVTEPEDIAALADAVARLVPVGLKVSQREIRDRMGLSEPGEDDELLQAPATSPEAKPPAEAPPEPKAKRLAAHGAGCACGSCAPPALLRAPSATPDGVALTDAAFATALEDWQDITDPLLDPLRQVLATATSFDEALALLEARGPDGARLAEALAQATAIARGIGDGTD
ncbi:DUF935 domain-containing protein [Azorhizobium sp. AG788]|uniref:DUF935 domain-containing protein n=1 Tax=Azorhizobium sp. AG788 TaxID=2183897 RepID=UPI003138B78E